MRLAIRKTDTAYSRYRRAKAKWRCERCGAQHQENSGGLHCSHFIGRRNEATRFDDDNTFALCHGCHAYFTANPYEHTAWVEKKLGAVKYKALIVRSQFPVKRDDALTTIVIKELIKTL